MKKAIVLLIASLAAISGVACGGSDSGDSEAPIVRKDDFVKRSEAICTRNRKEQEKALLEGIEDGKEFVKAQGEGDKAATAEVVTKPLFKKIDTMIDELASVGLPKGSEASAEKMIVHFENALRAAEGSPVKFLTRGVFEDAEAAARAAGLKHCTM